LATTRLPTVLRALTHRNFQLFFGGQLLSLTGTWMQNVAQAWLVYSMTGSSLMLGTVGFASNIPVFLLAPIGGAVADRQNRHHIVVATQASAMVLAFALAVLTLSGRIQVWHLVSLAALLGTVNAFDIPARQSFFVEMVGKEDLLNAIALNSSMFNAARVAGPAVAGILVASIGEGWCFMVNAISYLAVIAGLLLMRLKAPPAQSRARGSALTELLEGVRFVRRAAPIRDLLIMLGVISLLGTPYSVLMPIFAEGIFHAGPRGLGLLMGATGIGAVLGALSVAARTGVKGLAAMNGRAAAAFGVCLTVFALSHWFWLSLVVLIPVGFSLMMQMACTNTLIQTMVPDHLRGRVMALYSVMFMGMAPFGAFLAGALAEKIAAPATVAIGALICVGAAVVFELRLPAFRRRARELIHAQGMTGAKPPATTPPLVP
jgi:MFS family permease